MKPAKRELLRFTFCKNSDNFRKRSQQKAVFSSRRARKEIPHPAGSSVIQMGGNRNMRKNAGMTDFFYYFALTKASFICFM